MVLVIPQRIYTVSYTHLTYGVANERTQGGRQQLSRDEMRRRSRLIKMKKRRIKTLIALIPVSYTHLDVYKRQEKGCAAYIKRR